MEQWYDALLKKGSFTLAIDKLDNISVEIQIHSLITQGGKKVVCLDILKNSLELYEDRAENFEDFKIMIAKIKDLKWDNKFGNFYLNEKTNHFEELYSFPNVELTYVECAVCFEITKTKTVCGHPLCFKCFDAISNKRCPVCRACMRCCDDDD